MKGRPWLAAVLAACALAACSRETTLSCDASERYAGAGSTPPVRIPDDLSPPDESDALQLPPEATETSARAACLESPPAFYDGGAAGRGPGTARAPGGAAAPAPPASPEPPAGDREITD
jgi:hypothetical protein